MTAARPPGLKPLQRIVAGATAVSIGIAAWRCNWPFDVSPATVGSYEHPTVWQYVLSDRYTLGAARLGLVAFFVFVVVSIPALFIAARWAKGFGTAGVTTDDAGREAGKTLDDFEKETADLARKLDQANETIAHAQRERDTALRLLGTITKTQTGATGTAATAPILEAEREPDDNRSTHPADGGTEASGQGDGPSG